MVEKEKRPVKQLKVTTKTIKNLLKKVTAEKPKDWVL